VTTLFGEVSCHPYLLRISLKTPGLLHPQSAVAGAPLEQHSDTQRKNDAASTCQDIEDTPGGGLPLQLEILQRG